MQNLLWMLLIVMVCSCKTTGKLTGNYYGSFNHASLLLKDDSSFVFHWNGHVMTDNATGHYSFERSLIIFYYDSARIDTFPRHFRNVNYHLAPGYDSVVPGHTIRLTPNLARSTLVADTAVVTDTVYIPGDLYYYKLFRPLKLYYLKKRFWQVNSAGHPTVSKIKVSYRPGQKFNLFRKHYVYVGNAYQKSNLK